jgi:tetratricopeptide (TPR) repeat protein
MSNTTIDRAIEKAKRLAKSDDIGSALEVLDELIAGNPERPEVWATRAQIRRRIDSNGADQDLTRAIDLQAAEPHYHFIRGWYRLLSNRPDGAVADFSTAIELSDKFKSDYYRDPAYLGRAEAHLRLGHIGEAVADCEHIANADMTWPGVRSKKTILASCEQRG